VQADDHRQDTNGHDEDEFGRDDKTTFVVPELVHHL
jgi:hypothetical protein